MNSYLFDSDPLVAVMLQQNLQLIDQHILHYKLPIQHGRLLDIMSGPGMWMLQMARDYPHLHCTGIEVQPNLVKYAAVQRWAEGCTNATFLQVDEPQHPLSSFGPASFDFVNAALMGGKLAYRDWPPFIQEILALTKPAGAFRFLELEGWDYSEAETLGRILDAFRRGLWASGHCATEQGDLGLGSMINRLLQEADCLAKIVPITLDCSYGSLFSKETQQFLLIFLTALQPFLLKWGGFSSHLFQELFQEILQEVQNSSFQFTWRYTCVLGQVSMKQKGD